MNPFNSDDSAFPPEVDVVVANEYPQEYNPFASVSATQAYTPPPVTVAQVRDPSPPTYKSPPPQAKPKAAPPPRESVYGSNDEDLFEESKAPSKKSTVKGRTAQAADEQADELWGTSGSGDLNSRARRLRERELALEAKEKEIAKLEERLREKLKYEPNWPSHCYPLLHHDIAQDIPENARFLVKCAYATVLLTWVCLFWNWITMLSAWWSDADSDGAMEALYASIYLLCGIPGAWQLWYRSLYFANKDESTRKWIAFFINFVIHILFTIVMGLGIPKTNSAGIIYLISEFASHNNTIGIFSLVETFMWIINLILSLFVIKNARATWKAEGHSDRAKKEAVAAAARAGQEAASNPAVQDEAKKRLLDNAY